MMWLGSCPRCRGDLHLELDHFGEFISCLQCGMILNESQEGSLRALATARRFFGSAGSRSAILDLSRPRALIGGRG
jgi:hypothetical protein